MYRIAISLKALLVTCWINGPAMAWARSAISPEEAKAIAKEAYIYGFPMVMGYKLIYNYAVDMENPDYKGPFNKLSCEARLSRPRTRRSSRRTPLPLTASETRMNS